MKKTIKVVTNSPPLYWFIYGRIARHIYFFNNNRKSINMTIQNFIRTVSEMRTEQKKWFLFKDKKALKKAMALERLVDQELRAIFKEPIPTTLQLSLTELFKQ